MTDIEIQRTSIPAQVQEGNVFSISGVVDNLENVAPLLGGNCRNGTRQGELVKVKLTVEDSNRDEVTTGSKEICCGYGFDAQDEPFTFDVSMQNPGEYRIIVEAETIRQKGSGNYDKFGPQVVDVTAEGDGGDDGDDGDDDQPAVEILNRTVTAPQIINSKSETTVRSEVTIKNNSHSSQSVRAGMSVNGSEVVSGQASIDALSTTTHELKTTLSKAEVEGIFQDDANNPVTISVQGEVGKAGEIIVDFPDEDNGNNDGDGDENPDQGSGGVLSWVNDNPMISLGAVGLTYAGTRYYKDQKDGGNL